MAKIKKILNERNATGKGKTKKSVSLEGVGKPKFPKVTRKSVASILSSPLKKGEGDKTRDGLKKKKKAKIVVKRNTQVKAKEAIQSLKETEYEYNLPEVQLYEEKFNLKVKDVENAVKGVIHLTKTNPKLRKQLFDEKAPIFLQLSLHKIPEGHPKLVRVLLRHSILTPDDEICLIVADVKGIANKEHEKHIDHYQRLLKAKGVENIKKIMTFHEFRTEYDTFEQKLRLVDLYDVFLVDGRMSGKVVHKCGNAFYKKRKVPSPIKLQATKLKEHIEQTLLKVQFNLHLRSNAYTMQIGHTDMQVNCLVENVYSVIDNLNQPFIGGFENIKGINLFAPRTTYVPIYMSIKNPNKIPTPIIEDEKPKAYKTYTGELTTRRNIEVIVEPSGNVETRRIKNREQTLNKEKKKTLRASSNDMNKKKKGDASNEVVEKTSKRTKKRKINAVTDGDGVKPKKSLTQIEQEQSSEIDEVVNMLDKATGDVNTSKKVKKAKKAQVQIKKTTTMKNKKQSLKHLKSKSKKTKK